MNNQSYNNYIVKVTDFFKWVHAMTQMHMQSSILRKIGYWYENSSPWIFRGQRDSSWEIQSAFHGAIGKERLQTEIEDSIKNVEDHAIAIYRRRWSSLCGGEMEDIDILAFMQHHNCPTRLIDFTENCMVALFMAVYGECKNKRRDYAILAFPRDRILCADFWKDPNQDKAEKNCDLSGNTEDDKILHRDLANQCINPSKYHLDLNKRNEVPVLCIYPQDLNNRLLAQDGLFLMQRKIKSNFEAELRTVLEYGAPETLTISDFLYKLDDDLFYKSLRRIKFVFPYKSLETARSFLGMVGLNPYKVYPDFEGLSEFVKNNILINANDKRIKEEHISLPKINIPPKIERNSDSSLKV